MTYWLSNFKNCDVLYYTNNKYSLLDILGLMLDEILWLILILVVQIWTAQAHHLVCKRYILNIISIFIQFND